MPKKTSDTLPKHVEVILFSFIFEVLFLKIHVCSFIGFLLLAASKSSMITVAAASCPVGVSQVLRMTGQESSGNLGP
jgi:hypothetical protein